MARTWSRRGVLVALGTGIVAVSGALGMRAVLVGRAPDGPPASDGRRPRPVDGRALGTVAAFTGALFGHALSEDDHHELVERLRFVIREDSSRRRPYAFLAAYVDRRASLAGAPSFILATPAQRDRVVDHVMQISGSTLAARGLAALSEYHDLRRRIPAHTVPQLARLYRSSGVPWRARGYNRWPGVPGDPRAYTRPGA